MALARRNAVARKNGSSDTRIAAIDVGSNSVRQIVADVSTEGAISVVDEMKAAPRLGAELGATGVLGDSAIERAVEAISRMSTLAKQLGAQRIEAVATSAVRDASNADRFIARVRQETGLKIRVLTGDDEARLSFRSALAHFDLAAGRSVIMDIGGGSLEIAAGIDESPSVALSLPLGAGRLTRGYLQHDPPTPDERDSLASYVESTLDNHELDEVGEWDLAAMTSKTFRTLARPDDPTAALAEILQVREVLEEGLISRVAEVLTEEELDRLEAVVTEMEAAGDDGRSFPELDIQFHELLYVSLGNPLVPQLLGAFWTVFRRVAAVRGWTDDVTPEVTARRHRDILTALRVRDVEGARRAMADHFRGIEARAAQGAHGVS